MKPMPVDRRKRIITTPATAAAPPVAGNNDRHHPVPASRTLAAVDKDREIGSEMLVPVTPSPEQHLVNGNHSTNHNGNNAAAAAADTDNDTNSELSSY